MTLQAEAAGGGAEQPARGLVRGKAMQVTVETSSGLERRMTVQVPEEKISEQVKDRLKSMGKTARLHGFRPGKVPAKVLERTYGRQVRDEVVSQVLQSSLFEAFGTENLNPAGQPTIDQVDSEPGHGLSYTAVFEVYPEIQVPDAASIELTRPIAQVTDKDVENLIQTLRKQRRTWEKVDREATDGDRVTVDYAGTIEGEPFEGGDAQQVPVELGSHSLIEGFEEGLRGAKAGEQRTLDLTFPETYHAKELAGKPVRFAVTLHTIEEPRLPEIDEEFIKSFGVEDGGEEALRKEVRENMERELQEAIQTQLKTEAMDALLAQHPLELPNALVEDESKRLMEQTRQNLIRQGAGSPTLQLQPSLFEDQARRRVSLGLLLAEIVKYNSMSADPAKVRERVESIASSYQDPQQVISWYYGDKQRLAEIESLVMEDVVMEWIVQNAKVQDAETTFDAIMKRGQTSA